MTALVSAEVLKLRTIRSPWWLALALVLVSALAAAGAVGARAVDGSQRAVSLADAAESSSILAILLGVLLVTNEYRHGTIASTLLTTPARERVVAAKVVTGAAVGALAGVVASAASLAVAAPWLASRGEPLELGWPLVTAQLRLVGVFVLAAVLGVAVGAVVRSQIGAIVLVFVWFLVVESLLTVLGFALTGFERDPIGPYLPGRAIDALVSTGGEGMLDPSRALPLALAYVVALVAAGLLVTLRRDAV